MLTGEGSAGGRGGANFIIEDGASAASFKFDVFPVSLSLFSAYLPSYHLWFRYIDDILLLYPAG